MTKWICDGVEFKVGDKVKIVRKTESDDSDGMGQGVLWANAWTYGMSHYVGVISVIVDISDNGVKIKDNSFSYPLASLEKVNPIALPNGDFILRGKDGVDYQVKRRSPYNLVLYLFFVNSSTVSTYVSDEEILTSIENGTWSLQKSQVDIDNENRLKVIELEMQNLITEKEQLKKELAQ